MKPYPKPPSPLVDEAMRAAVRKLPCLVTIVRKRNSEPNPGRSCSPGVRACHYKGKRQHGDFENLWPSCDFHHNVGDSSFHTMGQESFQLFYGIDLAVECRRIWHELGEAFVQV